MIKIINVPSTQEVLDKFNIAKRSIWGRQLKLNEKFNQTLNALCKVSMDAIDAQEVAVQAIAESDKKGLKKASKAQAKAEKKLQEYKSLLYQLNLEMSNCQYEWGEACGKLDVIQDPNKIMKF